MFTPRNAVKTLYGEFVRSVPIDVQWSDVIGENYDNWTAYTAERCETCGKIVVHSGGEEQHRYIDDNSRCNGYISEAYPMMNYAYPVSTDRVGGVDNAARAIIHLPLCIVEWEGNEYLALTGGGMDLSWEIAEAYMRLGFLPPAHFADLPQMAGKQLKTRNRWILAGMRASLRLMIRWSMADLERLNRLSKSMRENTR